MASFVTVIRLAQTCLITLKCLIQQVLLARILHPKWNRFMATWTWKSIVTGLEMFWAVSTYNPTLSTFHQGCQATQLISYTVTWSRAQHEFFEAHVFGTKATYGLKNGNVFFCIFVLHWLYVTFDPLNNFHLNCMQFNSRWYTLLQMNYCSLFVNFSDSIIIFQSTHPQNIFTLRHCIK